MVNRFRQFEGIARKAHVFTVEQENEESSLHAFDLRNIHPSIQITSKKLFDDGWFSQATFEAFKYLDMMLQHYSNSSEIGYKLSMKVLDPENPSMKITDLTTRTEKEEQDGYRYIFAGSAGAIRNKRAHKVLVKDDPDLCLDHLSFASMLLRRLEEAGFKAIAISQ